MELSPQRPGKREIRPLTGLRGLAAFYVVLYHSNLLTWSGSPSAFVQHGYMAVDLFFVLSGFVMAMCYGTMFRDEFSFRHYSTFLIRRLARIYPLYLLVTCSFGFAMMANVIDLDGLRPPVWRTLLANVLMIQAWGLAQSIPHPAWSISTEWAAYLIFPVLATGVLFSRWRTSLFLCALAFVAITGLALAPNPLPTLWRAGPLDVWWHGSLLPLVRCVAEFSLGLAAYRAAGRADVQRIARHWGVALALTVAIVLMLTMRSTDVGIVALLPPLIISLAVGRGPVQALLGWQPVFVLGELSYAIYLLHPRLARISHPLAAVLTPSLGTELAWRISFVVMLFSGACLAHVLVEKPCRRAMRKLESLSGRHEGEGVLTSEAAGQARLS